MSITTGIDIVEINKIEKIILKWADKFINRIFSKTENEYCNSKTKKYQHYAVRFAAKEAFIKAVSGVLPKNISFKDIEVVNNRTGKPNFLLSDKFSSYKIEHRIKNIDLSLSHSEKYAIANVIVEYKEVE